ncbi:hypothetical protein AAF712_015217 [Marasmius tenuissimus]|uniref:Uncharacterized protein n=1 Tax=Marasmius tenuissimus TaxID=585030 RepID=A0ABR2ZA01_9AGAR
MRLSIFKKRYPQCHKAGLQLQGGKVKMKKQVEKALLRALQRRVPIPQGVRKGQLRMYLPPYGGDELDENLGRWYTKNRQGKRVFVSSLPVQRAHPELIRDGEAIGDLLKAREEINKPTDFYHDDDNSFDSEDSEVESIALPPPQARVKFTVYLKDGEHPEQVLLTPDPDRRVQLSNHKVELGAIGMEAGDKFQVWMGRWGRWISIRWETRLCAKAGQHIVLRKSDVRNMCNFSNRV